MEFSQHLLMGNEDMKKIKHSKKKSARSKAITNANDNISTAALALDPACNSAVVIENYSRSFGQQGLVGLVRELCVQSERVHGGDLGQVESMLLDQSHTLQAIFTNFAQCASKAEFLPVLEQYMRLALKAQAQCVRTLEVLTALKNPQTFAIVKQANIGQAVQVNNGVDVNHRKASTQKRSNKLLGVVDGKRLDARKTTATVSAYS